MKKISKILLVFSLLILNINYQVLADESFNVYDHSNNLIASFDSLSKARTFYEENKDLYDNIYLKNQEKVLEMKYGVVSFNDDDSCEIKSYKRNDGSIREFNSCQSADGAYLYSYKDEVYFKLFGDVGRINIDEVSLIPYYEGLEISHYLVHDDNLYFNFKASFNNNNIYESIVIDEKLDYLESDIRYYSYDGHYFYPGFYIMCDSYRSDDYSLSINFENPYYNHYQYASLRNESNYTSNVIKQYLNDYLGINTSIKHYQDLNSDGFHDILNESMLYDYVDSFFNYQNIFGVNGLSSFLMAIIDSGYGRSYNCIEKANFYHFNSVDSEMETLNNRHNDLESSIYNFMRNILSNRFGNQESKKYSGLYVGDNQNGIASKISYDCYYGYRYANMYYLIDKNLGFKDLNSYILVDNPTIYSDENLTEVKLTSQALKSYTVVNQLNGVYQILLDNTYNDGLYRFNDNYGYVSANGIYKLSGNLQNLSFNSKNINVKGEKLFDLENITIDYQVNNDFDLSNLKYDYYDLDYQVIDEFNSDITFKKINAIEVQTDNINDDLNLDISDLKLTIYYENGESSTKSLSLDMIKNYEYLDNNMNAVISYKGLETVFSCVFAVEKINKQIEINNQINEIINNNQNDIETVLKIKNDIIENNVKLSTNQIKYLDEILLNNYRQYVNYIVNDEKISISGLALAFKLDESIKSKSINTYYADILFTNENNSNLTTALNYDFEYKLNLNYKYNFNRVSPLTDMLIQMYVDSRHKLYHVFKVDGNNLIQTTSFQSENQLEFIADGNEYLIFSSFNASSYSYSYHYNLISLFVNDSDKIAFLFSLLAYLGFGVIDILLVLCYYLQKRKYQVLLDE